jgi:outer membrane lipoprotein-sorting protein
VNRCITLLFPALALSFIAASCAPRLAKLPSGPGTSYADFATAHAQATQACREVQTMRAVLAISGRAGRRFRAQIDAGFATPARVRLELPAPGKSLFIFVTNGNRATLLLPREERVLRDAPPAATLEALAGVSLEPDELRTIMAGCGLGTAPASGGRAFGAAWVAVDAGDVVHWLHQVGGSWQLAASTRGALEVRYADYVTGRPGTVRLRTTPREGSPTTDLTIRLSQVDVNEPLEASVFEVEIPSAATPLTLDELRRSGPLGK